VLEFIDIAFAVAVITTPVPVGDVKTMVGLEVHPALMFPVLVVMEVGTPPLAYIIPVTTQFAPPPLEVKAVVSAYPVPPAKARDTFPNP